MPVSAVNATSLKNAILIMSARPSEPFRSPVTFLKGAKELPQYRFENVLIILQNIIIICF